MLIEKERNIIENFQKKINEINPFRIQGRVEKITGVLVESKGPKSSLNDICKIFLSNGKQAIAEVVGFSENKIFLMPYDEIYGISIGDPVENTNKTLSIRVGKELLGHILDGIGRPIDGSNIYPKEVFPVYNSSPNPLKRMMIKEPLPVGIKAIDSLLTIGKGQRIGIFSGSGVGKSTLLGMIARNTTAQVNVIALIGERGREVREFIERDLGEEGLSRSIVVVSTSDQPAILRVKALYTATSIGEYFREQGFDVLLLVDSLTRWAIAQREIGLSIGEPPATRGYTPSVFANLPKILERAGNSDKGSLTAIYTVLVEGDDFNEPISDTVRGIVDGHIILTRRLAERAHYPAIDVLASVSRLMPHIVSRDHLDAAYTIKSTMAVYEDARDLIEIGAYRDGTDPNIDIAKKMIGEINEFLKQRVDEKLSFEETTSKLKELARKCKI